MYLRTTLNKIGGGDKASSGVGTYKPVTKLKKAKGGRTRQKHGWGGVISGLANLLGGKF